MIFVFAPFIASSYTAPVTGIPVVNNKYFSSIPFTLFSRSAILKKIFLINIGVFLLLTGKAQFYYTDIVLTSSNTEQLNLYKKNRVTQIKILSYEASGEASENFSCQVLLDARYSKVTTATQSPVAGNSWLTVYYQTNGKIARSVDSSIENVNTYTYTYNQNGNVSVINSVSLTVQGKDQQKETHVWLYDGNNQPQTMLWIKNGGDTSLVNFKTDEAGNVTEEEVFHKGISRGIVYYYYDNENKLTDIVRYNDRLKKLMPDNVFEFNDKGKISQMLSIQNGADYLIWRYEYNDQDLKIRELCYNKQKKLVGRIEYQYGFGN